MKTRFLLFGALFCATLSATPSHAADVMAYPDHVAKVLDVCPSVKLTKFDFGTAYVGNVGFRRTYLVEYQNSGQKAISAFEIRTLRFNPFDEVLPDFAMIVPGHDSGNFKPLEPGESDGDGTRESSDAELFTALAYVSKIRFTDGSIWRADAAQVADAKSKATAQK